MWVRSAADRASRNRPDHAWRGHSRGGIRRDRLLRHSAQRRRRAEPVEPAGRRGGRTVALHQHCRSPSTIVLLLIGVQRGELVPRSRLLRLVRVRCLRPAQVVHPLGQAAFANPEIGPFDLSDGAAKRHVESSRLREAQFLARVDAAMADHEVCGRRGQRGVNAE